MTVLITGMGRSGKTFLTQLFEKYGDQFDPPLYSKYSQIETDDIEYALNEPQCIDVAMRKGDFEIVDSLIQEIKDRHQTDKELVIQSPQLIFHNIDLINKHFDSVIVCIRNDVDTWIKSAIDHGGEGYLVERPYWLPSYVKTMKDFYYFWFGACISTANRISDVLDCIVYCMGENASLRWLLKSYGYRGNEIDHKNFPHWKGSRFEEF